MLVVLFSSSFGEHGLTNWKSVPGPRLLMYKTPWYSLVQGSNAATQRRLKTFAWCWGFMSSSYISKENTWSINSRHICVQTCIGWAELAQTHMNRPKARAWNSNEMQIVPFIALRLKSKHHSLISTNNVIGDQTAKSKGIFIVLLSHLRWLILVRTQKDWVASEALLWKVWCMYGSRGTELDEHPAVCTGWTSSSLRATSWKVQHGEYKSFSFQQIADKSGFLPESQRGKKFVGSVWNSTYHFPRLPQICFRKLS